MSIRLPTVTESAAPPPVEICVVAAKVLQQQASSDDYRNAAIAPISFARKENAIKLSAVLIAFGEILLRTTSDL